MPVLPPTLVPLLRLCYLLGCFVATWVLLALYRPPAGRVRAAIVAGGVQLWLGILLDAGGVALGWWRYGVGDGLVLGVPADLHLAWALLWGVAFCALAPRDLGAALRYLLLWWAATLAVDGMVAPYIGALCAREAGLLWLLGDAVLLGVLLAVSLLLARSVESRDPRQAAWRALIYLPVFTSVGLLYVPEKILNLAGRSLWPVPVWPVLLLLLGACAFPGLWAVVEFARAGGTPLPYDPPARLVVTGPYAYVRNPMQLSGVLMCLGLALIYRSWLLLVYALDLMVLSEVIFHRNEDPQLAQRGGPAYGAYVGQVNRWLPRLRPYHH